MRGLWTSAGAAAALLAGWSVAGEAWAQCASVMTAPVAVTYDPTSAVPTSTTFSVTVTNNTCGAAQTIFYGVANALVDANGVVAPGLLAGLPVSYDARLIEGGDEIGLDQPGAEKIERSAVLDDGQGDTTIFTFQLAAGSDIPYDERTPSFVTFAREPNFPSAVNNETPINLTLAAVFNLTVGGAGTTGLIDFLELEATEPSVSVNIHAQATTAFRIHLSSEQGGVMRNTTIGAGAYFLTYAATLDSDAIDFDTPYQDLTTSGTTLLPSGTAILPFQIDPDTSDLALLRAGIYRDVVTLTIWPVT